MPGIGITYNLSNLTGAETFVEILDFSNQVTGNFLGVLFIMAVFFILLFRLRDRDFEENLFVSSFVCFILSLMASYLAMIAFQWSLVFFGLMIIDGFYIFVTRKK